MKIVKLTKVDAREGSVIGPGYWVKGYEDGEPELGKQMILDPAIIDSDDRTFDWFLTTSVQAIEGNRIVTRNSVWTREVVSEVIAPGVVIPQPMLENEQNPVS